MSASPEIEPAGLPDGRLRPILEGFFGRFLEDEEVAEAVEETLREAGYWDEDLADVFTWAHLVLGTRARVAPREEFNALVHDVGMGREEAAGLVGVPNLEVVRDTARVPVSRDTDMSDEVPGTDGEDATAAVGDEAGADDPASDPIALGPGGSDDIAPVAPDDPVGPHESAPVAAGPSSSGPSGDIDPDDDPWALDPLPRQSVDPVEDDPEREPAWYMTRDGWMSAESVGTSLRDGFATEDLETGRWTRARRVAVTVAAVIASTGALAAVAIL